MTDVFVGLGSNKGNRKRNILRAVKLLERNSQRILKVSSIRETRPYGYKKQGLFLNAAVKLKTKFLFLCKKIEKEIGRRKSHQWGPREIDLDILFFGNKIVKTKKLTIPHKDLHNRKFVLIPLVEISSNFIHPVFKKRVSKIKAV